MKERNTIQKMVIRDTVRKMFHPTAEDVYNEIKKKGFPFSLPTIYRNLNLMVEAGELKILLIGGEAERFDSILTNHYHLKCTSCGEIFDIPCEMYDDSLDEKCEKELGIKIQKREIEFVGLCGTCNKTAIENE